jgi:hypothetical protein
MAHRHHHHHHGFRRRNPFGAGNMNKLAIKVGGGLVGGIAAATIPNMVMPSLATGWGGVAAALAIAFGGSFVFRSSVDFSEGILIGGTLQAAGRISQLLIKKNLVSFSLSGYGPMFFPVPTPAWNQMAASVPSGSASVTSKSGGAAPTGSTGMGKWAPRGYKYAA